MEIKVDQVIITIISFLLKSINSISYLKHLLSNFTKIYNEHFFLLFIQEFKKTLRLSDSELAQSPKKSLKIKAGKKFGSLGAIFATNHNKDVIRTRFKERMAKSEESLENSKQDLSEDDSDEETQSNSDGNISISDDNITESPQVVRKHKK